MKKSYSKTIIEKSFSCCIREPDVRMVSARASLKEPRPWGLQGSEGPALQGPAPLALGPQRPRAPRGCSLSLSYTLKMLQRNKCDGNENTHASESSPSQRVAHCRKDCRTRIQNPCIPTSHVCVSALLQLLEQLCNLKPKRREAPNS